MWVKKGVKNAKYSDDQLETEILLNRTRLFFLDGPTKCGKTHFLKHMNSESVLISPFCIVQEELFDCLKKNESLESFYDIIDQKFNCKILGLEDIDISLAGKHHTQGVIAILLNRLCRSRKIILTGIDIDKRCSELLRSLGLQNYVYYQYVE